jgi:molybdopterin biosynthesis enzyme
MTHFGKGVSGVHQWTSCESKEMTEQFLPLVAGTVDSNLLALTQAVLDFMYRVHTMSLSEDNVQDLHQAMEEFSQTWRDLTTYQRYT